MREAGVLIWCLKARLRMSTVGLSFYGVEYSPVAMNQTRAMVSLVRQVYGPYNAFSCKKTERKVFVDVE